MNATTSGEQSADKPPQRGLRVLVVDDNRDLVLSTMALLRTEGHETKGCYTGTDVIENVRQFDPDVVLLDIGLPGVSGWEVAREIRRRWPAGRPKLIGITGEYTKGADRLLGAMSGFDYYLIKPADPTVLLKLLADTQP